MVPSDCSAAARTVKYCFFGGHLCLSTCGGGNFLGGRFDFVGPWAIEPFGGEFDGDIVGEGGDGVAMACLEAWGP